MKPQTSDFQGKDKNILYISLAAREALQQIGSTEVERMFDQFRLNLQSRIVGCDDRTLLKLQGNLEYLNELEKVFKDIIILKKS